MTMMMFHTFRPCRIVNCTVVNLSEGGFKAQSNRCKNKLTARFPISVEMVSNLDGDGFQSRWRWFRISVEMVSNLGEVGFESR